MKVAIDVHYREETAKIVAVLFNEWADDKAEQFIIKYMIVTEEYIPGEFYKRELPCIVEILKELDLDAIDCIVVDGFVYLDDDFRLGLGGHLYENLTVKTPVIGVAKSNFLKNKNCSEELFRGESIKPLYITAAGIELPDAVKHIELMHGDFRMPTLLQQLDTKTKEP